MPNYKAVPDEALLRMAAHSESELRNWERWLLEAQDNVRRAERMVDRWRSDRDEQFFELDVRDIPAPDGAAPE